MTKQTKTKETVAVNFALPADLHAICKSEAAKARKTLTAFVVEALRSATKSATRAA